MCTCTCRESLIPTTYFYIFLFLQAIRNAGPPPMVLFHNYFIRKAAVGQTNCDMLHQRGNGRVIFIFFWTAGLLSQTLLENRTSPCVVIHLVLESKAERKRKKNPCIVVFMVLRRVRALFPWLPPSKGWIQSTTWVSKFSPILYFFYLLAAQHPSPSPCRFCITPFWQAEGNAFQHLLSPHKSLWCELTAHVGDSKESVDCNSVPLAYCHSNDSSANSFSRPWSINAIQPLIPTLPVWTTYACVMGRHCSHTTKQIDSNIKEKLMHALSPWYLMK